jgi:dihydrofolate reductase
VGRLLYAAISSLDGYVADREGQFDWSAPDEQVHAAVNDLMRPVSTHLYGRRMYDVLVAWETMEVDEEPPAIQDYASLWRAADKVVYSRTLTAPRSARTRIERDFRPAEVADLKGSVESDLVIGGPELAAQALRDGLVDDVHLFMSPVVVGDGTRALPDDVRLDLELQSERAFDNGVVHLHYGVRR